MNKGQKVVGISALDVVMSENGKIDVDYLSAQGYHVGHRARKRLRADAEEPQRGGRPKKMDDHELLMMAKDVLSRHSKPGIRIVRGQN